MSFVDFAQAGFIGTITLNDPERRNAMSEAMGDEFKSLMGKLKKGGNLRVIILTGAGRAFSSGGDFGMLKRMSRQKPAVTQKQLMNFYKNYLCVTELPIPVIAAINGPAVGAGFCLAIACDLKYAVNTAKMGANFAKLGISPGMGGSYSIARLAGLGNAAELLYTGNVFEATVMERLGLINAALPPEQFATHVQEIAQAIASNSPVAIQKIKACLKVALHKTPEQMFAFDARAQSLCLASADAKEGLQAAEERRAPQF